MLLPRPEIRMATRLGSCIVCRGPILCGIPGSCRPCDGAAALTRFDPAELEHGFARAFENGRHLRRPFRRDNDGHADPAIEGPRHLLWSDPSSLLQQ